MGKTNFGMGGRGQKSVFTPKNKEKYIGDYPILSRSSWELKMMQFILQRLVYNQSIMFLMKDLLKVSRA